MRNKTIWVVLILVLVIVACLFLLRLNSNQLEKIPKSVSDLAVSTNSSIIRCSNGVTVIFDIKPNSWNTDIPTDSYYGNNGILIVECGGMPLQNQSAYNSALKKCADLSAELKNYNCSKI